MSYVNAPIHDLLIRIKNGYMARKITVEDVVYSKFKANILDLLKKYGFIEAYEIQEKDKKRFIRIKLSTVKNPVDDIPKIKFYSKPSRPWYIGYKDIKPVASGKGI
ncbi:MAG: 30S ribosomal protein S8 [bacterium]|nr:30S ribosomal protein S8 [bacterium]